MAVRRQVGREFAQSPALGFGVISPVVDDAVFCIGFSRIASVGGRRVRFEISGRRVIRAAGAVDLEQRPLRAVRLVKPTPIVVALCRRPTGP
jgi:hypothetical protein